MFEKYSHLFLDLSSSQTSMTALASRSFPLTMSLRHISWRPRIDMPETGCFLETALSSSITRSCWRCVLATYSILKRLSMAFGRHADNAEMVLPRPLLPSIRTERPFSTASKIVLMNSSWCGLTLAYGKYLATVSSNSVTLITQIA